MEASLLEYFVLNNQLTNTCDFNPVLLEEGPGIYEVFKVENGLPLFLEDHINRFYQSAKIDDYSYTFSRKELLISLKTLIEANKIKFGNIRFQLVKHPKLGNLFMAWVAFRPYPSEDEIDKGIKLLTHQAERNTPHAKRVNIPLWKEAEKIISKTDISEVLLVDENGMVTEGSRSNIFFVKGNALFTPLESQVLPGITRLKIIELAKAMNIPFFEEFIPLRTLNSFDACFLSSTSKSVLHITKIDQLSFDVPYSLIQKVDLLYKQLADSYLENFLWT